MDERYDANFGEWIRNEDNARNVGYNLRKYIDIYDSDSIVVCVKWIVKDWTLRSIIALMKKMLLDDFHANLYKKMDIAAGVIYTWNTIFTGEFLIAMIKGIASDDDKTLFAELLLKDFSPIKVDEIVKKLDKKLDNKIKTCIAERKNIKNPRTDKVAYAYTFTL